MSYIEMQVAPETVGLETKRAYEQSVTLTVAGNSDWIMIPRDIWKISCTISFTAGATGKVQATTDNVSTVKNGSPVAVDWDSGVVTATTQDVADICTAIRAVQVGTGTTLLTVRAM